METQERVVPNFDPMKDYEIIEVCGDDASMWAAAFCQTATKLGIQGVDEGWMIGWFANAIEASWDKRVRRAEPQTKPVLPEICSHGAALSMPCPLCEKLSPT